jgi:hypothetical protein
MGNLQTGKKDGLSSTMEGLVSGNTQLGGVNLSGLGFLLPFLGPEGEALMSLCNINLSMLLMGFMGIQTIVPKILEEVSNRTRQLTLRLTWNEGAFEDREFVVTTYVSSLPEEQLQELKEMEDAKEVLEGAGVIPPQNRGEEEGEAPPPPTGGGR